MKIPTSWLKKIAIVILQIALGVLGGAGYQAAQDGTSSVSSSESSSLSPSSLQYNLTDSICGPEV